MSRILVTLPCRTIISCLTIPTRFYWISSLLKGRTRPRDIRRKYLSIPEEGEAESWWMYESKPIISQKPLGVTGFFMVRTTECEKLCFLSICHPISITRIDCFEMMRKNRDATPWFIFVTALTIPSSSWSFNHFVITFLLRRKDLNIRNFIIGNSINNVW